MYRFWLDWFFNLGNPCVTDPAMKWNPDFQLYSIFSTPTEIAFGVSDIHIGIWRPPHTVQRLLICPPISEIPFSLERKKNAFAPLMFASYDLQV